MQDVFQLFVKDNINDILTRLGKVESEFGQINQSANSFGNSLGDIGNKAFVFNQIAESVGRINDFFENAINKAGSYSDQIADIQKTTGQTRQETEALAGSLGKLDTRTSMANLLDIAKIGGSIGVAKDQLAGFVQTVDMATVALGDEFSGGVEEITRSLGTLKGLFGETKGLRYDEAMSRIGSSINYLGSVGTATGGVMAEFANRIGQLGTLAPTVTQTLGLGATLQELGLTAEIASGGLTNLILVAGENADRFARQLGMTTQAFRDMLSNSPNDVIIRLAESFKGLAGADIIQRLNVLKIGTQESIKVFQALAENTDLLKTRQNQAAEAFAQNTSLSQEFAIKNETLGASLDKTRKFFEGVAVSTGRMLAPMAPLVTSLGSLAQMGVPVVGMLGRLGTGLMGLLNPYALATAGGIALLGSFIDVENGVDSLNIGLRSIGESLNEMSFSSILDGFSQMFASLGNTTKAVLGLKGELTALGKVNLSDLNQVASAVDAIQSNLQQRDGNISSIGTQRFTQGLFFLSAEDRKRLVALEQGGSAISQFYAGMPTQERKKFEEMGVSSGWLYDSFNKDQARAEFLSSAYGKYIDSYTSKFEKIDEITKSGIRSAAVMTDEFSGEKVASMLASMDDAKVKRATFLIDEALKNTKPKSLSEAFTPPPTIDELKSIKSVGQEISGGGSRPTNIYINIGKFQDQMIINTETTGEATGEIEDKFNDTFLRILRGVNQYN